MTVLQIFPLGIGNFYTSNNWQFTRNIPIKGLQNVMLTVFLVLYTTLFVLHTAHYSYFTNSVTNSITVTWQWSSYMQLQRNSFICVWKCPLHSQKIKIELLTQALRNILHIKIEVFHQFVNFISSKINCK